MSELVAVILAAGMSKRMKSAKSKILHEIMGRPVIEYVLDVTEHLHVCKTILVVGFEKEMIMGYLGSRVEYAEQNQQLGTAHAAMQALPGISDFHGDILIICGDMPLLSKGTLEDFIENHRGKRAKVSLLTALMDEPGRLGRIIRQNGEGSPVRAIVEAADATPEQLKIKEVNTGTYIFDADYLRSILPRIGRNNAQKEMYLTDTISISVSNNIPVEASLCRESVESLGVNNRADLALANRVMKNRINLKLMMNGVTLYDPENTYIEASVVIEQDTTVLPGCIITGKTEIGSDCIIGPNCRIENSLIASGSRVCESVVTEATIGRNGSVGPFAHMRPGSVTEENVKIGNFVETKKSRIGANSKASHLSYIGDAQLGMNVNIGAGTITCNYDGVRKNPTTIEDGAFIGSNSSLVAPVTIGRGAVTGAGSVVTKNVPAYKLAVGLPARAIKTLKKD